MKKIILTVLTLVIIAAGVLLLIGVFNTGDYSLFDNEIIVNNKKITLSKKVWESDQTVEIKKSADNTYEIILPEGASIYRWKAEKTNLIHEERVQYIFNEDLEGISQYLQYYTFEFDENTDEFKLKLINIDDIDVDYDRVDGKILTFHIMRN